MGIQRIWTRVAVVAKEKWRVGECYEGKKNSTKKTTKKKREISRTR
jgi:hypothetical protein